MLLCTTTPTNKDARHNGSSVGIYTVHMDSALLAPKHTLSQHLLRILVNIVLCYIVHLHVYFDIKSYAQLALINKIGTPLSLQSSVGNSSRVHCWLGLQSTFHLGSWKFAGFHYVKCHHPLSLQL